MCNCKLVNTSAIFRLYSLREVSYKVRSRKNKYGTGWIYTYMIWRIQKVKNEDIGGDRECLSSYVLATSAPSKQFLARIRYMFLFKRLHFHRSPNTRHPYMSAGSHSTSLATHDWSCINNLHSTTVVQLTLQSWIIH